MEDIKFTPEIRSRIWHRLKAHTGANPINDTDTFVKCVHGGSVEHVRLSYTFMERLEQAKDEAITVQDFHAAADIRDLMDKFKRDGKSKTP